MMELNLLDHPEFICGAIRLEPTETGLKFSRMSSALEKIYSDCEARSIRANCPSGIRIKFGTDADYVALAIRYGRESRPVYAIDVIVDGGERQTFAPPERQEEFSFNAELPAGLHEVEILLPHLVECTLLQLEVSDDAQLYALLEPERSLLFLGDSITQGMTVSSPALTWPAQLAARRDADFVNLGVGGARMDAAIGEPALDYEWDTAFVAFGINDFAGDTPLDELRRQTRALLTALSRRNGATIYFITPLPWVGREAPNAENLTLAQFRAELAATAAAFPAVIVIDGAELLPEDAAMFVDNLHPNDIGMTLLADHIEQRMKSK